MAATRRLTMSFRLHYTHSIRALHIQQNSPFSHRHPPRHCSPTLHLRPRTLRRQFGLPPLWLRPVLPLLKPLVRPLLVLVGGFLAGVMMQLWKGQPPQWLLAASAPSQSQSQSAARQCSGRLASRLLWSSVLLSALYATRLRNPAYAWLVGTAEAQLELAEAEARPPWNAFWDSRSANDSMQARLAAMERYLGQALSAAQAQAQGEQLERVQRRAEAIRRQGYSNAMRVVLDRADFWAESGELVKFEQMRCQLQRYRAQAGETAELEAELDRVTGKAYGVHCSGLLAKAQTLSSRGAVSECQSAVTQIRDIEQRAQGVFVDGAKLEQVLLRAHQCHVRHMVDEARRIKQSGARRQAERVLQQARQYARLHGVELAEQCASTSS